MPEELGEDSKLRKKITIKIGATTRLPGVDYNEESFEERQRQMRAVYEGRCCLSSIFDPLPGGNVPQNSEERTDYFF